MAGRASYAFYRAVPAASATPHQVGKPDDVVSAGRRRGRTSSWSETAPALRYAAAFEDLRGVELVDQWLAHPSGGAPRAARARYALREEFVNPWDLEPVYLRRPDAEINWETRDSR